VISAPLTASIIVPVKNGGSLCLETLAAVLRQESDQLLEVVVVDSASTDGSIEHLRRLFADIAVNPRRIPLRLHMIRATEFGHGRTRNLAAKYAQGEIIVLLSQDAMPEGTGWLTAMLKPFSDPQVAGTFCRQIRRQDGTLYEGGLLERSFPTRSTRIAAQTPTGVKAVFSDAAGAIRRSVWERFPYCDVISSEDQHWARAVLQAGFTICYVAEAIALHSHRITFRSWVGRAFDSGVGECALPQIQASEKERRAVLSSFLSVHAAWLRYVVGYSLNNGTAGDAVFAFCMQNVTVVAHFLGTHHRRLPRRLCRALSAQPNWFA
jgi:GT2 family glycosyltransferase